MDLVLNSEASEQLQRASIGRQREVPLPIPREPVTLVAAGRPSDLCLGLEERDILTPVPQTVGHRKPQHAGADDRGVPHQRPLSPQDPSVESALPRARDTFAHLSRNRHHRPLPHLRGSDPRFSEVGETWPTTHEYLRIPGG